jgi:hypothetical protein
LFYSQYSIIWFFNILVPARSIVAVIWRYIIPWSAYVTNLSGPWDYCMHWTSNQKFFGVFIFFIMLAVIQRRCLLDTLIIIRGSIFIALWCLWFLKLTWWKCLLTLICNLQVRILIYFQLIWNLWVAKLSILLRTLFVWWESRKCWCFW